MKVRILIRVSVLLLLAVTLGYGQTLVRGNVPFSFTVQGKLLPAGQYEIARDVTKGNMRIAGTAKGATAFAPVLTRLAKGVHTVDNAHLVFDKVGDVYSLSELWVPGQDGYLLHSTKGEHEHTIVDIAK